MGCILSACIRVFDERDEAEQLRKQRIRNLRSAASRNANNNARGRRAWNAYNYTRRPIQKTRPGPAPVHRPTRHDFADPFVYPL